MNHHKRKYRVARRGISENIHLRAANDKYRNMIFSYPHCENFCIEVLERFERLLQRFAPTNTPIFNGNEVDAFIALANLEKSIDSQAVKL